MDLIETDKLLSLSLNGSDSMFLDSVMYLFSSMWIWAAVALVLLFMLFRNNPIQRTLLILLFLAVTVILCDQCSSAICKPLFARFRPTQDIAILDMVDTVSGYRGGKYGFFSSHAANSFGIVTFLIWIVRNGRFSVQLTLWAAINSYSRIYLGVHFLGDVLVGMLAGILFGTLCYWLLRLAQRSKNSYTPYTSSQTFTRTGYMVKDITLLNITLYATYLVILFMAVINMNK